MRGKRRLELHQSGRQGNIPAYAGKTYVKEAEENKTAEHPRVCGENSIHARYRGRDWGTSPRMRGKRKEVTMQAIELRNIPAYAGKTSHRNSRGFPLAEHPRVCGENSALLKAVALVPGTSPRMRGKPELRSVGEKGRRNIPAYAGKTSRTCMSKSGLRGTSPRMRGKRKLESEDLAKKRNIPAYAGKTDFSDIQAKIVSEHPRVCGENPGKTRVVLGVLGTSPRMRGKHLLTCGSSFLKVILHSVLFFCTVGVPWNPLQLPPF